MGQFYYKVGQFYYKVGRLLQCGTILLQSWMGIAKWDNFITKWDGYYKVGQCYYVVGWVLQSGTILLQSGMGITKWANCYKVVLNSGHFANADLLAFHVLFLYILFHADKLQS